ncbi:MULTISPECIES: porin family protein [Culturomica]|jgi:hypothetical protein|uniref:porin family protein n=1 Tax=Culturomica TaxID=1926651 RepID=UPI00033B55B9|nr:MULTISPECIES: porin family protein [Odoribacteraceae]RHV98388.1 PorT family protein [Odoribacter sp. OF09-27XD]CCZ09618.1 putative uncharacterized protein [Odoribacter sp. CAG:788]HBO25702.1 PorT family protein [Culturomica sp.]
MKKLFILLAVCLGTLTCMAQSPLNFGIHGGISNTKIKVKDVPTVLKNGSNTGYMFGVFARVNLGPLYVEPSLNYSHKEGEVKGDGYSSSLKYNSFDIPLMVGLHILDLPIVKLRAYLGPVVSFTGKLKWDKGDFGNAIDNDKTMWNGKIGVGVDVWKLTFDIDYEKGLKKFQNDEIKIKAPRSFNFTLGFKII